MTKNLVLAVATLMAAQSFAFTEVSRSALDSAKKVTDKAHAELSDIAKRTSDLDETRDAAAIKRVSAQAAKTAKSLSAAGISSANEGSITGAVQKMPALSGVVVELQRAADASLKADTADKGVLHTYAEQGAKFVMNFSDAQNKPTASVAKLVDLMGSEALSYDAKGVKAISDILAETNKNLDSGMGMEEAYIKGIASARHISEKDAKEFANKIENCGKKQ